MKWYKNSDQTNYSCRQCNTTPTYHGNYQILINRPSYGVVKI